MSEFLNRDDAPFEESVWDLIDSTVKSVATQQLSARKLLHIEGPYGLGVKSISMHDQHIEGNGESGPQLISAQSIPLVLISSSFSLDGRDLDLYTKSKIVFDMKDLVSSVLTCAKMEDKLLYYGSEPMKTHGLTNSPGTKKTKLREWSGVGDATESVIEAINELDKAGFHGPYSLALEPTLYNSLFRRYPQEEVLEFEHLKSLVGGSIIKASALNSGGVLVASGEQFATIALGQDLMAGFEGPEGMEYVFFVSESIALRVNVPESVCVMQV
ncbi:family 1 encapsulin nanocompartment shell protein [Chitinispirillales bacterium ANBcel5]|uniref:family 1 encapsulin nanocompartment shell protein n=1 Tax=Cellulosispirillum alkaliphilum TaxID=3039283 RepID=UPI002A568210|nr:family 1 encapsulin nanocompartment shell protein [Chitinispirillales bacterium ANBcel5]